MKEALKSRRRRYALAQLVWKYFADEITEAFRKVRQCSRQSIEWQSRTLFPEIRLLVASRKSRSCHISPDAPNMKNLVDARSLRTISRIVLGIKQRIDSGASRDDAPPTLTCDPDTATLTSYR